MIRAYLRASTQEQDATRAKKTLEDFVSQYGQPIASTYVENASGATREREALARLLSDANEGDVILVESIDRLSRLSVEDWESLRAEIESQGLRIVAVDLPTTHQAMQGDQGDDLTKTILDSINRLMVDLMALMARKDYEQRRARQLQGIEKAKSEGKYRGRPVDLKKRARVSALIEKGCSIRETAKLAQVSTATVQKVKAQQNASD